MRFGPVHRRPVQDINREVAWAHLLHLRDPRASPWTSHRDWLGYRRQGVLDQDTGRAHGLQIHRVHGLAGGQPWSPRPARPQRRPLLVLSRIAAEVLGRVPGDRRSFDVIGDMEAEMARRVRRNLRIAGFGVGEIEDAVFRRRLACFDACPEVFQWTVIVTQRHKASP